MIRELLLMVKKIETMIFKNKQLIKQQALKIEDALKTYFYPNQLLRSN